MFHDLRRDFFRVFDGQPLPIKHERVESCFLGHRYRVQWVDLPQSGQRHGCHSLSTTNHILKTATKMDHSHHHMHMDHSVTPDTSAAMVDRCVMYMLWFVKLSHCIPNLCIITRLEVPAGIRISSIHASYSVNGTSTPTSSSSLAASRSSSSVWVTSGYGMSRRR